MQTGTNQVGEHPSPQVQNSQGVQFALQGRLMEAAACFEQAVHEQPNFAESHNNLGMMHKELGRLEHAIASYRQAIQHRPAFAEAHYNLALALLKHGELAEGWAEYEWRWATPHLTKDRRAFGTPRWRGEAAEGRTVLIHAEQGLGDTLQFCRYVTLTAARGLRTLVEAPRPLVRLLRSIPGVHAVVEPDAARPPIDFSCPMMSLPLVFGTTLATIPAPARYLKADAALSQAWQARLAATPYRRLRVGLCWAGNAAPEADHRRAVPPPLLAALNASGCALFSLQKEASSSPDGLDVVDYMGEMTDFADTSALIVNLDLVVSVDTAVAHLAGALGKPVWLLSQFDPCWRWLVGRSDSPWYPALRSYGQPSPGAWPAVLAAVAGDLRAAADRFDPDRARAGQAREHHYLWSA